jgi:hypothetical protein
VKYNQLTTKTFVQKAKNIFGAQYDYSLVDYKKSSVKVRIVCHRHGFFEVSPNNHLRGMGGCPKCSMKKKSEKRRCSLQEIIDRAVKKHGGKYDYFKVIYKGNDVKIEIICPLAL